MDVLERYKHLLKDTDEIYLCGEQAEVLREDQEVPRVVTSDATHRTYVCPVCGRSHINIPQAVFYGRCEECGATLIDYEPAEHQKVFHESTTTYKLMIGGFGCNRVTDKVLMYDGSIKEYQELRIGDKLMGKDSTPRTILDIHTGFDEMYEVKIDKYEDEPIYVTANHELYLRNWTYKYKGDGSKNYRRHGRDTEDTFIKVKDYLGTNKRFKKDNLWIFTQGIDFPERETRIDPYFLGLLLGDGSFRNSRPKLSSMDKEISEYYPYIRNNIDKRNGMSNTVYDDTVKDAILTLGLWNTGSYTKFIPDEFKINSREVRLRVLAGLIDTDGHASNQKGYEITLASERMIDDIIFIAKSLGMIATKHKKYVKAYPDNVYYRAHISGINVDKIPVKLERKKVQLTPNKRHDLRSFSIEKVNDSEAFIGITVDVDNLYVEGAHLSVLKNSGKTTATCAESVRHALTTPNGRTLITAMTLQQVKEAVLPELNKFIPPWYLINGKSKGNPPVFHFKNGHTILIYASDQEDKLRSLNLTRFHIEEGSGVNYEIFKQLQTRLRNPVAQVRNLQGYIVGNKFSGDVSTNPEDGWIRDEFLLKSKKVYTSPTIDRTVYEGLWSSQREDMFESFISASFDNPYLPEGTIARISAGRNERWKRKYLYCYLDAKEGLVYKDAYKNFVEPFPIPKTWLRLGGFDPGIGDPTACLLGAIDPKDSTIYVYWEYYVPDAAVSIHGKVLNTVASPFDFLYPIQADPSVNKRSQQTGYTYRSYFKQMSGINLVPANNDILYGITKLSDYIVSGKVKFFNNLEELKREFSLYAYPRVDDKRSNTDVPIDKHNHLMDALRYLISKLPSNPFEFRGVYIEDAVYSNKTVTAFSKDEDSNLMKVTLGSGAKRSVTSSFRKGG